jgi:hypothetical protein
MAIPYPASRWSDRSGSIAVGRLLSWDDDARFRAALEAADIIEGFTVDGCSNLYNRLPCVAWTLQGCQSWRPNQAWVYVFARDVSQSVQWAPLPSGDWLHQAAKNIELALPGLSVEDVPCSVASAACISSPVGCVTLPGEITNSNLSAPATIIPNCLFIGSQAQSRSAALLQSCGVTHIVDLTETSADAT